MATIVGLGIDIVSVPSLRESIDSSPAYAIRVFTSVELAYADGCPDRYQTLAGRMAAKEAAMKALGTGWTDEVDWKDIEVTNHDDGRPILNLLGNVKLRTGSSGINGVWVSISHTPEYAAAVVILSAT